MSWVHEELDKRRRIYDAACAVWRRARDAGSIVREEDEHERHAGVRWRAVDGTGRAALSGFQLAKSELDHISERVQREAGNTKCPTCPEKDPLKRVEESIKAIGDQRLPPERDEEVA